jgi:hypothetical protein
MPGTWPVRRKRRACRELVASRLETSSFVAELAELEVLVAGIEAVNDCSSRAVRRLRAIRFAADRRADPP